LGAVVPLDELLLRMHGQRVYFDTSPLIYAMEDSPQFAAQSIALLRASEQRKLLGFTGIATLMEMLVGPLRKGQEEYSERLKVLFLSGDIFQCVDHPREAYVLAAMLRARSNYKAIDALHLATARTLGCQFFVTNDEALVSAADIEVVLIKRFTVVKSSG
jgi:predicted nucleic acid-binding protein